MHVYLTALWLIALAPVFAAGKNVFAHFMAANSESHSTADWENEINAASAIGIQGFVLNMAGNPYEPSRIADAYSVAEARGFLFFFSFDFAFNWDIASIASLISTHANSPSTFKWNSKLLVSSFSGQDKGNAFWATLKSTLARQGIQISLAPASIPATRLTNSFHSDH